MLTAPRPDVTEPSRRLAEAIRHRREQLGWTQAQLAAAAGISDSTVHAMESGRSAWRSPRSLPAVETALGWEPGSGKTILAGGQARMAPPAAQTAPAEPARRGEGPARLPLRIAAELASGEVVDTDIIELGEDDEGLRLVVVVKADEHADVTKLRRQLERWVRAQKTLRELPRESP